MAKIIKAGNNHLPRSFFPFVHSRCGSEIQFFNADIRMEPHDHKFVTCPVCKDRIPLDKLERTDVVEENEEQLLGGNPGGIYAPGTK